MQIIKMKVGDTLELKKPHPCGEKRFTVMRVGSEIRIVCAGCGRDMVLDRIKLEKAVRRVHTSSDTSSDTSADSAADTPVENADTTNTTES